MNRNETTQQTPPPVGSGVGPSEPLWNGGYRPAPRSTRKVDLMAGLNAALAKLDD